MTPPPPVKNYAAIVQALSRPDGESEWVEFKLDFANPKDIGQYISALANSAALNEQPFGYLLWGVEDGTGKIVGTHFDPHTVKKGNEPLENWLLRLLEPGIHFSFHVVHVDGVRTVLAEIERARSVPVRFEGMDYIRVGSVTRPLRQAPERERALWQAFDQTPFEKRTINGSMDAMEAFESLVELARLIDAPPRTRNEAMAAIMRRVGLCEERGSGIDKVMQAIELAQLPAPLFETPPGATRVVVFARHDLGSMSRADRIRAVYQHACLRYVVGEKTGNASVRERFGISSQNAVAASRLLSEALKAGVVVIEEPEAGAKRRNYLPYWAAPAATRDT